MGNVPIRAASLRRAVENKGTKIKQNGIPSLTGTQMAPKTGDYNTWAFPFAPILGSSLKHCHRNQCLMHNQPRHWKKMNF